MMWKVDDGDRADIAKGNDRMVEGSPPQPFTRWEDYYQTASEILSAGDWGTEDQGATSLKDLIDSLIGEGKTGINGNKEKYYFSGDIEEIRDEIMIEMGWDSDSFRVEIAQEGFDFELTLSYPDED